MTIDSTLTLGLFWLSLISFGAGAFGALVMAPAPNLARIVGHGSALLGAVGALALGIAGLWGGNLQVDIPNLLPIGGAAFGMDHLSAFLLVLISVGAIPAALYAVGYTRHDAERHSAAAMGFALNVFVAAMILC